MLAPDGSQPEVGPSGAAFINDAPGTGMAWKRTPPAPAGDRYPDVLDEAIAHLDQRDRSHRAALDLILAEMDRLPRAEGLWEHLANRLDVWNLDDDLGTRYERALERFRGPSWWARAARWYAARQRSRDLERLASELVARFRSAGIFERSAPDEAVRLAIPDQPKVGTRVRLVLWADWFASRPSSDSPRAPRRFRQARADCCGGATGNGIARDSTAGRPSGSWSTMPSSTSAVGAAVRDPERREASCRSHARRIVEPAARGVGENATRHSGRGAAPVRGMEPALAVSARPLPRAGSLPPIRGTAPSPAGSCPSTVPWPPG